MENNHVMLKGTVISSPYHSVTVDKVDYLRFDLSVETPSGSQNRTSFHIRAINKVALENKRRLKKDSYIELEGYLITETHKSLSGDIFHNVKIVAEKITILPKKTQESAF